MPTGGVEVRFLVRSGNRTHGQARGVAVLLDPANRVQVEGIIQGLREGLRAKDHMLGRVQGQETAQQGAHHGPGKRHRVTRPAHRGFVGTRYGRGPAAAYQPHQARRRSHQHGRDHDEGNQAPRDAGLTQHNRRDSHQGKSQERGEEDAQTRGDAQRPAHRVSGNECHHDREKQQRNSCQPAHKPSSHHSERPETPRAGARCAFVYQARIP